MGTCGLDLLPFLENVDNIIFIDAVKSNHKIGSIIKIEDINLLFENSNINISSLHDLKLIDVLKFSEYFHKLPNIIFYGITIESINTTKTKNTKDNFITEITFFIDEEILKSIDKVILLIIEDINKLL